MHYLYNEFKDKFNIYNGININNSTLSYILWIIPIDSIVDLNEYAYLVAIRYKHKDCINNKIICIESLNPLSILTNNVLFYNTFKKKFINIVVYYISFTGD